MATSVTYCSCPASYYFLQSYMGQFFKILPGTDSSEAPNKNVIAEFMMEVAYTLTSSLPSQGSLRLTPLALYLSAL